MRHRLGDAVILGFGGAAGDVRGETACVDDGVLQDDRDVSAGLKVSIDVAVADQGRDRFANVAACGANALGREMLVGVGPKDFAQLVARYRTVGLQTEILEDLRFATPDPFDAPSADCGFETPENSH